ncbi:phosphopantetheine-binding protein [Stappia sp. WLB 29]|uniref:acyl carrier protein n=1 Tax=Stappia sp. WLB 29 TaxID=2925220 RepID=UPI0020BFB417|nr:phosphopantetheine-binding protein [Stappia sp. WLB 29]
MGLTAEGMDAATIERLLDLVAKEGMVEREKLSADATFEDLGIQSADMVVILMAVEEEFGVYIPVDGDLAEARTLGDFLQVLAARMKEGAE